MPVLTIITISALMPMNVVFILRRMLVSDMCCMICTDWIKGNLTTKEAWRNLNEMSENENKTDEELAHIFEVAELISKDKTEDDKC
jgi:hypothetical protein